MSDPIFSMNIEKHAPIKSMRISEIYCPWINKDLRGLIRERDKMIKEAVIHNSPPHMESYRRIRNKVNRMNINLKRQHFSERMIQAEGNMEETWRKIKQFLNKRSKSTNIDLITDKGTEITTKKDISIVIK